MVKKALSVYYIIDTMNLAALHISFPPSAVLVYYIIDSMNLAALRI